jgi:hypothetical protein
LLYVNIKQLIERVANDLPIGISQHSGLPDNQAIIQSK